MCSNPTRFTGGHLATCRKQRRRQGAFPFSLGFFVQSAPARPNVPRTERGFPSELGGLRTASAPSLISNNPKMDIFGLPHRGTFSALTASSSKRWKRSQTEPFGTMRLIRLWPDVVTMSGRRRALQGCFCGRTAKSQPFLSTAAALPLLSRTGR